jgi:hypothetical protein
LVVQRTFTFGPRSAANHWPRYRTLYGSELAVTLSGESVEHCRAEMLNRFGRDWAFDYNPLDAEQLMPQLVYVPATDWPAPDTYPDGRFEVGPDGFVSCSPDLVCVEVDVNAAGVSVQVVR